MSGILLTIGCWGFLAYAAWQVFLGLRDFVRDLMQEWAEAGRDE